MPPRRRIWALALCAALGACGGAKAPSEQSGLGAIPKPASSPGESKADLARRLRTRGVLDVAAELLGDEATRSQSVGAKLDFAEALLDAAAFERAKSVLEPLRQQGSAADRKRAQDLLGKIPTAPPAKADAALNASLFSNWQKGNARAVVSALEPLTRSNAEPALFFWLGRAEARLGHGVLASKAWARGRSRLDAMGAKFGSVIAEAGAVDHVSVSSGLVALVRVRDLRLVGGYQASNTNTEWLELYSPNDGEPLSRIRLGYVDAFSSSPDGRSVVLRDRAPAPFGKTVPESTRVIELITGRLVSEFPAGSRGFIEYTAKGDAVLAAEETKVAVVGLDGTPLRALELSGKTPGIMRVYRGPGAYHDNVPIEYPTAPVTATSSLDGSIAVGASDGTVRVWKEKGTPLVLEPPAGRPKTEESARNVTPLALRLENDELWVVRGDGSIEHWNISKKKRELVFDGACSDAELEQTAFGSSRDAGGYCRRAAGASIDLDGKRVLLTGMMRGVRVRQLADGAPTAAWSTFATRAMAWIAGASDDVWMGSVSGQVEHWNAQTGALRSRLEQGSIAGFLRGISGDGRFVAVTENIAAPDGTRASLHRHVWDQKTGTEIAALGGQGDASFAANASVVALGNKDHIELWSLEPTKRLMSLAEKESMIALSADGRFIVTGGGGKLVVRDASHEVSKIDLGKAAWYTALSEDGSTLATTDEQGTTRAFRTRDGKEIASLSGVSRSPAISSDGSMLAHTPDPKSLSIVAMSGGKVLAHVEQSELGQNFGLMTPLAFAGKLLFFVGPGAPGYSRLYRWQIGQKPVATELQVLTADRAEVSDEVVRVYDRNDSVYLVRISDGALLATVSATNGGGYVVQSASGALDGPEIGRGALFTFVDGLSPSPGFGWWAAWDRFHVDELLPRAARGESVAPLMPSLTRRSITLGGSDKTP